MKRTPFHTNESLYNEGLGYIVNTGGVEYVFDSEDDGDGFRDMIFYMITKEIKRLENALNKGNESGLMALFMQVELDVHEKIEIYRKYEHRYERHHPLHSYFKSVINDMYKENCTKYFEN